MFYICMNSCIYRRKIMGDTRRYSVFGEFIVRNFPLKRYKNLLIVADGDCHLSDYLHAYHYQITSIEAKFRKSLVKKKDIHYIQSWFTRDSDITDQDVILGLHPDDATVEILLYAKIQHISFAVVPCCLRGDKQYVNQAQHEYLRWIDVCSKINQDTQQTRLLISGKNIVLFKRV